MSTTRRRAIIACLVLALCATPFLFWQPDWTSLGRATQARATSLAEGVQRTLASATPRPTDTRAATPTGVPTATQTPCPTVTLTPVPVSPTPRPIGHSRGQPYPLGQLVHAPNWDVQVMEAMRGDEAWLAVQDANRYNKPAPDGFEYILVKVACTSTHADDEAHKIGGRDFALTGDRMVRYSSASVVEPHPQLDAEMYANGATMGWVAFAVGMGEGNLILILDPAGDFGADSERFLAIDADAQLQVNPKLALAKPDHVDSSRNKPVPLGQSVTTENWQVAIHEVVRGSDAWQMVQQANRYNKPPDDSMEYVAIRLHAQLLSLEDVDVRIDKHAFSVTGSANILHGVPSVVNPSPAFEAYLYPGGAIEGWIVQQCQIDETDLVLLFKPRYGDEESRRFLALQ